MVEFERLNTPALTKRCCRTNLPQSAALAPHDLLRDVVLSFYEWYMTNRSFHVYILASISRTNFVKVGRTNNQARVKGLMAMEYAGVADWEHKASFPLESDHGTNGVRLD